MATLHRFARPGRIVLANIKRSKYLCSPTYKISTSKKNDHKVVASHSEETHLEDTKEFKELKEHFADANPAKLKNWISHGWSDTDREADQFVHNITMFSYMSCGLVLMAFIIAYFPDYKHREWATREAYLELDRREKAGLPLIDPYYIPPEQMTLPSEEEIGSMEVII